MGVHWEGSLDTWQTNATGSAKKAYRVMKALFLRSARDLQMCPASYLPTKNNGTLEAEPPSLASDILRDLLFSEPLESEWLAAQAEFYMDRVLYDSFTCFAIKYHEE